MIKIVNGYKDDEFISEVEAAIKEGWKIHTFTSPVDEFYLDDNGNITGGYCNVCYMTKD